MTLSHRAVRALMQNAAHRQSRDPDRLSFTHSIRVIRRKLATAPALSPKEIALWLPKLLDEILPPRQGRYEPRGVKRKMSGYPIRRSRGPTLRRGCEGNPSKTHEVNSIRARASQIHICARPAGSPDKSGPQAFWPRSGAMPPWSSSPRAIFQTQLVCPLDRPLWRPRPF